MNLTIGVLGAARIAGKALVAPAKGLGLDVIVAARDEARALLFAREHGVPRTAASYEALLEDPRVDAIYVALPAALHEGWAERALLAGKHVLVEKPATLGIRSSRRLVTLAADRRLVLHEAHHSDFHPLRAVFSEALREVGPIWHVEAWFDAPIAPGDIRRDTNLGAGSLTDFGCYLVRWMGWLGLGRPAVGRAAVRVAEPEVDDAFYGEGTFPDGATFSLSCDMHPTVAFRAGIAVVGRAGRVVFENPLALEESSVGIALEGRREIVKVPGDAASTYRAQLEAFVAAIRGEASVAVAGDEIVRTQEILAELYAASGLRGRDELARSGVSG